MKTLDTNNSVFDLAFRESEGRLAIWYKSPSGMDYFVDPLVLFNAIVDQNESKSFLLHKRKQLWYSTEDISTHLMFDNGSCLLLVEDFIHGHTELQKTSVEKFWRQVKSCFVELHKALKEGMKTYYADDVKCEELDTIVRQFDIAELCIRCHTPFTVDVEARRMSLNFENFALKSPQYSEMVYHASIGNIHFTGSYDGDYENPDTIRHRLEDYIYNNETQFYLKYEKGAKGYHFLLDDYATIEVASSEGERRGGVKVMILTKVVAKPIALSKGPAIVGLCEPRQVVREIYESLLNVGRCGFRYTKGGGDDNEWHASPMTFYNKVKSNIVEDYINDIRAWIDEVQKRQTVVKHVYTICPDYGGALFHDEEGVCDGTNEDDTVQFDEENTASTIMTPGIYEWQREFETQTDGVTGTMGTLDSEAWNKRGLELAQQIRQQLPDEYDLWYAFPFEDEQSRGKRAFPIYKKHDATKNN